MGVGHEVPRRKRPRRPRLGAAVASGRDDLGGHAGRQPDAGRVDERRDRHRHRWDVEDGRERVGEITGPEEVPDGRQEPGRAWHEPVEGALDRRVADLVVQGDPRALREHEAQVPCGGERRRKAEKASDGGVDLPQQDCVLGVLTDSKADPGARALDDERDADEDPDGYQRLRGPILGNRPGDGRRDHRPEEEAGEQPGEGQGDPAQPAANAGGRERDQEDDDDEVEDVHWETSLPWKYGDRPQVSGRAVLPSHRRAASPGRRLLDCPADDATMAPRHTREGDRAAPGWVAGRVGVAFRR